jgi:hypothetical protein
MNIIKTCIIALITLISTTTLEHEKKEINRAIDAKIFDLLGK